MLRKAYEIFELAESRLLTATASWHSCPGADEVLKREASRLRQEGWDGCGGSDTYLFQVASSFHASLCAQYRHMCSHMCVHGRQGMTCDILISLFTL